jgi:hypothetical protein
MKDFDVPETICHVCGHKNDGALEGNDTGDAPESGDVSICIKCQTVCIFNDDMSLREPTEADILEMPWDQISRLQRVLKELHADGE